VLFYCKRKGGVNFEVKQIFLSPFLHFITSVSVGNVVMNHQQAPLFKY